MGSETAKRSRRLRPVVAAVVLVGTTIAAITLLVTRPGAGPDTRPGDAPASEGPRSFALPMSGGVGENAGVEGTLHFTEGNCPYLEDPDGGTVALLFVSGSVRGEVRKDGRVIVDAHDGHVWATEGEETSFGGGPPPEDWQLPAPCVSAPHSTFVAERPSPQPAGRP